MPPDTDRSKDAHDNGVARGYDFRFGYTSGYNAPEHNPPAEDIINGQCELFAKRLAIDPMRYIPTASCFRDSTPRTTQHWIDLGFRFHLGKVWYLQPDEFRTVVRRMKEMSDALPDGAWAKRIFMIDNWNEWDEGHYVSPSHEFGFRYLQAIREELTARDNLPDYRLPQDLGLSANLNKTWEVPDLGPICEKRFGKER